MLEVETKETIHIYYEREEEPQPFVVLPLLCALLCLLGILATVLYSAEHPYYEHKRLAVPAIFLPPKVFTAEVPIIPTGIKTYPATYAHGYLTFSNGSVIGLSIPAGFTIDGAMTDRATYVPPATANGFGTATVPAHLVVAGVNKPMLAINEVIGSSLFIRNLSPFTGGKPAYSVKYVTSNDRITATSKVRALILSNIAQTRAFLAAPCEETKYTSVYTKMYISWRCHFAIYKVPSFMHIISARLSGKSFLVGVSFIPLPKTVWVR